MQADSTIIPDGAVPASLWRRAMRYLDWKANPVLLRDLRLYLRGKLMLAAYFLTLAILVLGAIAVVISAVHGGMDGSQLLYLPTVLLSLICGALVPNLVGERFRAELASRATELALVSPLTAGRLVRGKLIGAWCLSMLVMSAAAPVFATVYLLGGVNPMAILGIAGGVMLAGVLMPLPQLCLATNTRKQGGRILFGLLFVVNIILMFSYASLLYETFAGGRSYMAEANRAILISACIAAVLIGQFLYFVTVSRLRLEAENRDAAPRISLAAAAVGGWVSAFLVYSYVEGSGHIFSGADWEELVCVAGLPVAYAFCWGTDSLSHFNAAPARVVGEEWRSRRFRRIFLSTGPQSLAAYFMLVAGVVLLLSLLGIAGADYYDDTRWRCVCLTLAPIMGVLYGFLCYLYVVRRFLRKRPGPNVVSYTVSLTNAGLAIVTIFALVLTGPMLIRDEAASIVMGGSPLGVFIGAFESRRGLTGIVWTAYAVIAVQYLALLPAVCRREHVDESGLASPARSDAP